MTKDDRSLSTPHITNVNDDTDNDEDSEDDDSSVSSDDENNNKNEATTNKEEKEGHRIIHLPSFVDKMQSFCICRSCMWEQIPSVINNLVKTFVDDANKEGSNVSNDKFATKWLKKNSEKYVTYLRDKLCIPIDISDRRYGPPSHTIIMAIPTSTRGQT